MQEMNICNSWFEHRINPITTWTFPDGLYKNEIDYIVINERYRNGVTHVQAKSGTDCGSDHNPVEIKIKIKLKMLKNKSTDSNLV